MCTKNGTLYSHRHHEVSSPKYCVLRLSPFRWGSRPRVFEFPMLHAFPKDWFYAFPTVTVHTVLMFQKKNHQPNHQKTPKWKEDSLPKPFLKKIHQPPFCCVFSLTSSHHEVTYTMVHLFFYPPPVRSTGPRIFNPTKTWEILACFFRERRILTTPGRFRKGQTGQNNWLGKPAKLSIPIHHSHGTIIYFHTKLPYKSIIHV